MKPFLLQMKVYIWHIQISTPTLLATIGIFYAHVEYSASAQNYRCSISHKNISEYRIYPQGSNG